MAVNVNKKASHFITYVNALNYLYMLPAKSPRSDANLF
jgi:hypothetical protein